MFVGPSSEWRALYTLSNIGVFVGVWLNQSVQLYFSNLFCPYPVLLIVWVGNYQPFMDPCPPKSVYTLALVHLKTHATPKSHENHRWKPVGRASQLGALTTGPWSKKPEEDIFSLLLLFTPLAQITQLQLPAGTCRLRTAQASDAVLWPWLLSALCDSYFSVRQSRPQPAAGVLPSRCFWGHRS